jgi:hypothetical protein
MVNTSEYETWAAMCKRGRGSRDQKRYIERGISVCQKWMDSFEAFLMDMGRKPTPDHSIDRIDNNKGYSPENCRWATRLQQCRNKEITLYVEFKGERRILRDLSDEFNMDHSVVRGRLRLGWPSERIFSTPVIKMKPRKDTNANH